MALQVRKEAGVFIHHSSLSLVDGCFGIPIPCTSSLPPWWAGHPHVERGRTWQGLDAGSLCDSRWVGLPSAPGLCRGLQPRHLFGCLGSWDPAFGVSQRHTAPATVADLEFARPHSTCRVKCVRNGIICYLSAAQQPCMKNNTQEQIKRSVCQQPVEMRKGCC